MYIKAEAGGDIGAICALDTDPSLGASMGKDGNVLVMKMLLRIASLA